MPASGNKLPNFEWPDGSGFQFDLPPHDMTSGEINHYPPYTAGGLYDVTTTNSTRVGRDGSGDFAQLEYNGWSMWIDKIQPDYRFAAISDSNAGAFLFPNVHDPWMFSEYVYEGESRRSSFNDAESIDVGIVPPSLFDPELVDRTFEDGRIQVAELVPLYNQPPTRIPTNSQTHHRQEDEWASIATGRNYWKGELDAIGWVEPLEDGGENRDFTKTGQTRSHADFATPTANSGVRLYRERVWSHALRWGQSQNIPDRVITHTAPPDWMKSDGALTGRIVPHVQITTGTPIYDNSPDVGGQGAAYYEGGFSGSIARTDREQLGLKGVAPVGVAGPPDSTFTYPVPSSIDDVATIHYLGEYSHKNSPQYEWTSSGGPNNYGTGSLVHRGCAFWRGSNGTARCEFYWQNQSRFTGRDEVIHAYDNPLAPSRVFSCAAYDPAVETVRVEFRTTGGEWVDAETAGRLVEPLRVSGQSTIDRFKVGQLTGNPVSYDEVRARVFANDAPVTDPKLCAFTSDGDDVKSDYAAAGGVCPNFTPQGQQIMAAYQGVASNGAEWANQQRGLPAGYKKHPHDTARGQAALDIASGSLGAPSGGFGIGFMMGMQAAASVSTPDPYTRGYEKQEQQTISVTFEPEIVPIAGKTRFYDTPDGLPSNTDPEADIRIRPGTGQHVLDLKSNEPYSGVDSTMFGFVNQINYRVKSQVQHCYRSDRCDPIITGIGGASGWIRNRYSNVDFTEHPLKMPGVAGLDGTDKACHYGDSRCPHTRLDRRAVEYDHNYRVLLEEVLLPFITFGINAFTSAGFQEAFLVNGKVVILNQADFESSHPDAMCVAVRTNNGDPAAIGHWQPVVEDAGGTEYRVLFYYTNPSWDLNHQNSRVAAHLVQFDDNDAPCYMPIPPDREDAIAELYGNTEVPWLVELFRDYVSPEGNPTQATNAGAFAGGSHPEYKDHSHRGREIVGYIGGVTENFGAEGRTESNQFGGPRWNRSPVSRPTKMGYWTDRDGEWRINEALIPTPEGDRLPTSYVSVSTRIQNIPPHVGPYIPIDGVPGFTLQDSENSDLNRKSDYAAVGATYSADTPELLAWFRERIGPVNEATGLRETRWWTLLEPRDEENNPIPKTAPPRPYEPGLPRERIMYRCSLTGVAFTEEMVNHFLDPEAGGGEWYPIPADAPGDAVCGSPYATDAYLYRVDEMDRIPDARARGWADVWSVPGTTVRHDGYFWKAPTHVNRLHVDQIQQKLGPYHARGGGYDFDHLTQELERWGRLPVSTAARFSPGVLNQLLVPGFEPGDSVRSVRDAYTTAYGLTNNDEAFIQNGSGRQDVSFSDEPSTLLSQGDTVVFTRQEGAFRRPLGLPIGSPEDLPVSIVEELDLTLDDMPQRSDYDEGPTGEQLFERELQLWRIASTPGSYRLWASNASSHASSNLLANQLAAGGKNPVQAYPIDPATGQPIQIDERILAPYSEEPGGGMKMVSLPQIKSLRNQVLPLLAYSLNNDNFGSRERRYTANGDFYDTAQASNAERFQRRRKDMPMSVPGVIPPQVLAATSTGKDYYVEWEIGDAMGTKARAYYPVGTTWWRMNQKVGCIRRSGGTNALHLDDPEQDDYTGDHIESAVAFFLHGQIPMDKEVAKVYLVYRTQDGPHAPAIGCQGQYTGEIAKRALDGTTNSDDAYYGGHTFCFWQHFHPWTMGSRHEGHAGSYDPSLKEYAPLAPIADNPPHGIADKKHVEELHGQDEYRIHELGQPVLEAEPVVLLEELPDLKPLSVGYSNEFFRWAEGPDAAYAGRLGPIGLQYIDSGYGWNTIQPFHAEWLWGNNITQVMTEHEIWKSIDYGTYDQLQDRYSVQLVAAVDTTEVRQSVDYLAAIFRNNIKPYEHQGIPGWLDFSDANTSNRISRRVEIEDPTVDTTLAGVAQVIVQEGDDGPGGPGGGNGEHQAGDVPRVLDITKRFKEVYDDRVDRFFKVQLGWSLAEMPTETRSKTVSNQSTVEPDHWDTQYPPEHAWNYRYFGVEGMWLSDPWHHPPLLADEPITANADGDPIPQNKEDQLERFTLVTGFDDQGIEDVEDPEFYRYHPRSLMLTDQDLDPESPATVRPLPLDDPASYWRVESPDVTPHSFEVDLRSTPYMIMDRPWRYKAPEVDSSNAVCPNTAGCWVSQRGWTVGQYYEAATSTWGFNAVPSTSSRYCANCNTDLSDEDGFEERDGDGIRTVAYDPAFVHDSIVTAVEVSVEATDAWHAGAKHGFVVEAYNSVTGQWRKLFQVEYDTSADRYAWMEWSGSSWVRTEDDDPPETFRGGEGNRGLPNSGQSGVHFVIGAYSKLRLKVVDPSPIEVNEPESGWTSVVLSGARVTSAIAPIDPVGRYIGRVATVRNSTSGDTREFIITSLTEDSGQYVYTLAGEPPTGYDQIKVEWTTHVTRCTKFRVWGYPYSDGEVTITPPATTQPIFFSPGNSRFRLASNPTQIFAAECQVGEGRYVPMERKPAGGQDFIWQVEAANYHGTPYHQITAGAWSFDVTTGTVEIATEFIDPTDGLRKPIWELNQAQHDDGSLPIATAPTQIVVDYFSGIGVPINVQVEAAGEGPSYQLGAECVTGILNNSGVNDPTPPDGITSDALPHMGSSEPMPTNNGQPVPLDWQVYNHDPLNWVPNLRWYTGDELPAGGWSDASIHDVLSGGRGDNYSDVNGRRSLMRDWVTGEVTLYGTPSTILSGDLAVYARDYTTRTYTSEDGTQVVTRERTGGYRSGSFVFRLTIPEAVSNARKSVMCSVPDVLVYLRERSLDEPL